MKKTFLELQSRTVLQHSPETPNSFSGVIQISGSLKIQNWYEKMLFTYFFMTQIFTVTAKPKKSNVKGANNIFSNTFGISRLPEAWITPDELYGAILWFFHTQNKSLSSPYSFSCYELQLPINMMMRRWWLIFGWTVPLSKRSLWV